MDNSESKGTETPEMDNSLNDTAKIERYKQQLQGSAEEAKKAAERAKNLESKLQEKEQTQIKREYNRVWKNESLDLEAFKSLASEDPELADSVAKQFTVNNKPIESAKEIIEYYGVNAGTKSSLDKENLSRELYEELKAKFEQDGIIKSARSRFANVPEGKRDEALSYFEKITGGRKLSESEAQEFADMASLYVMKDGIIEAAKNGKDTRMASMAAMSFGNNISMNNQSTGGDNSYSDDEINEYVMSYAAKTQDNQKIIQALTKN